MIQGSAQILEKLSEYNSITKLIRIAISYQILVFDP